MARVPEAEIERLKAEVPLVSLDSYIAEFGKRAASQPGVGCRWPLSEAPGSFGN